MSAFNFCDTNEFVCVAVCLCLRQELMKSASSGSQRASQLTYTLYLTILLSHNFFDSNTVIYIHFVIGHVCLCVCVSASMDFNMLCISFVNWFVYEIRFHVCFFEHFHLSSICFAVAV